MKDRGRSQKRYVGKSETKRYLSVPTRPWLWFEREMLESPAWRALSRAAMSVVFRLCIEHSNNGGRENSRLTLGYDDFVRWGIHRSQVHGAIEQAVQLGFVRCMQPGRRAYGADPGTKARYRITFYGVVQGDEGFDGPPTDDWKRVTEDDALRITTDVKARARRAPKPGSVVKLQRAS